MRASPQSKASKDRKNPLEIVPTKSLESFLYISIEAGLAGFYQVVESTE
jgi:hypothetical protein